MSSDVIRSGRKKTSRARFLALFLLALGEVRAGLPPGHEASTIHSGGDPATRIDIVIVGVGYLTPQDRDLFRSQAVRCKDAFFAEMAGYAGFFNVHTYDSPDYTEILSPDYTDHFSRFPSVNSTVYLVNAFGWSYSYLGGDSVVYTVREPDFDRIFVHEFAHSFGHLVDEHAISTASYGGPEPIQANATRETEIARVKWRPWVEAFPGTVGLFEGAFLYTNDVYRPQSSCLMRRVSDPFCKICKEQMIFRTFDEADLDAATPAETILPGLPGDEDLSFQFADPMFDPNDPARDSRFAFQWRLNGRPVGTDAPSLTLAGSLLSGGDDILEMTALHETSEVIRNRERTSARAVRLLGRREVSSFSAPTAVPIQADGDTEIFLIDLDGDGASEIGTFGAGISLGNRLSFYRLTGAGFENIQDFTASVSTVEIERLYDEAGEGYALGDFDSDGLMDILVPGNDGARFLLNRGNGFRVVDAPLPTGTFRTSFPFVLDFNGDGRLDWGAVTLAFNPAFQIRPAVKLFENRRTRFDDVALSSGFSRVAEAGPGEEVVSLLVQPIRLRGDTQTSVYAIRRVDGPAAGQSRFEIVTGRRDTAGQWAFQAYPFSHPLLLAPLINAYHHFAMAVCDLNQDGVEEVVAVPYRRGFRQPESMELLCFRQNLSRHLVPSALLPVPLRTALGVRDDVRHIRPPIGFDYDFDGLRDLVIPYNSSDAVAGRNPLLKQVAPGRFAEAGLAVSGGSGVEGAVLGDLDGDGEPDLLGQSDWPGYLTRLETPPHKNRIAVDVRTRYGSPAIGATVQCVGGEATQNVTIYATQSEPSVFFGLGAFPGPVTLHVTWPSGRRLTLPDIPVNQKVVIREPAQ